MIEYLKTKLHQDVEGTCSGRMGSVLFLCFACLLAHHPSFSS